MVRRPVLIGSLLITALLATIASQPRAETTASLPTASLPTSVSAEDLKPSSYAPAKELVEQLEGFMKNIAEDLKSEDYGEDQHDRISRNANTIAILALVLGKHDQPSAFKQSTHAIIDAATAVAESADDQDACKTAFAKLEKAGGVKSDKPVEWAAVADIAEMMKQVPVLNNTLRRGVQSRRFERTLDRTAGLAATLAAIGQATMYDTTYCADEADEKKWARISLDFRDASASVHKAVRAKDQDAAKKAIAQLAKTCDDCHHSFRD